MNDIEQLNTIIKNLTAQMEATRQLLNETLQGSLNLRTNLLLLQQTNEEVNKQNHVLANKILELSPPQVIKIPDEDLM